MKKMKAIFLCVFMLAALSGCRAEAAKATGAALTASGSLEAFITAVERFEENIMRSAPWDEFDEDDAIPMDPVDHENLRYYFRPLFNLGVSKDSMEREKGSRNWDSVTYEELGNKFRIVCMSMGSVRNLYEGTYDPASDRLKCRSVSYRMDGKVAEDIELEYTKTDFGYVARLYDIDRKVVHKLAIKGDEGVVSWGETKFDTLHASVNFPKEGRHWYEISGDRFVLQPWDGPAREYKTKR